MDYEFIVLQSMSLFLINKGPFRWKALIAFLYVLLVSWLTAFTMVIVHDRVPDMEKYPPLPDLLLGKLSFSFTYNLEFLSYGFLLKNEIKTLLLRTEHKKFGFLLTIFIILIIMSFFAFKSISFLKKSFIYFYLVLFYFKIMLFKLLFK